MVASYTPPQVPPFPDVVLWPGSPDSIGLEMIRGRTGQQSASAAWPTLGLAIGVPVRVRRPLTVYQLGWVNGATPSGNADVGIFTTGGTLLVSTGSTAMAGASTIQRVDVTDTVIGRGLYYLVGVSSATGNWFRWAPAIAPQQSAWGCVTIAATAIPLATGATFARGDALVFIPSIFAQCRSVF